MSYNGLHLDAKTAIARTSIAAWNALMRADPVFGRYALSAVGRSAFVATFTVISNNEWRIGDKLHRIDGPARVYHDGGEAWYKRGRLHRTATPGVPGSGGPAVTYANGNMEWYARGQQHRVDTPGVPGSGGPACVYNNGTMMWFERGRLHRVGGPAIIYAGGSEEWYEHGDRHRRGGPAVTYADGTTMWYTNGIPCAPH